MRCPTEYRTEGSSGKMASYGYEEDASASKRMRTDENGGSRGMDSDSHKFAESPVVHVRGLSRDVIESDMVEAVQHFGPISYVLMMPRLKQALVEFEDISGARNCVEYCKSGTVLVCGVPAYFNYSTSMKIKRIGGPAAGGGDEQGNNVLLFTILDPKYPVTVDVLHTICNKIGKVLRIVIFRKNAVQAMVEFEDIETARKAKDALNGADIYSGCCTLKIEYAKPTRLNVRRNDQDSWDYTINEPESDSGRGRSRGQPLLAEPHYGGRPALYDLYNEKVGPQGTRRTSLPSDSSGQDMGGSRGGYGMDGGMGGYGGHSDSYSRMDRYGQHSQYGGDSHGMMSMDRYGSMGGRGDYEDPRYGGGMPAQGAVLMVYINDIADRLNCQRLFNVFCLYGNVVKVTFMRNNTGAAMVQMADQGGCERAIRHLNNSYIFNRKIGITPSKQPYLQTPPGSHDLEDGTPFFVDFETCRNNRFSTPASAQKNRIESPGPVLHFYNAPPEIDEDEIHQVFNDAEAPVPIKTKLLPSKARSSSGLLQWDTKENALEALALANHCEIPNKNGKIPYVFKLAFSSSQNIN